MLLHVTSAASGELFAGTQSTTASNSCFEQKFIIWLYLATASNDVLITSKTGFQDLPACRFNLVPSFPKKARYPQFRGEYRCNMASGIREQFRVGACILLVKPLGVGSTCISLFCVLFINAQFSNSCLLMIRRRYRINTTKPQFVFDAVQCVSVGHVVKSKTLGLSLSTPAPRDARQILSNLFECRII